jgi:acyl carrier protein
VSNNEIIAKVNSLMQQGFEVPEEKLIPTATVFEDLGLDSLDAVDMLVNLEDRLGVKVDVEKLKGIRTLQDVYNLVSDLTAQNQNQIKINQ